MVNRLKTLLALCNFEGKGTKETIGAGFESSSVLLKKRNGLC